ncbi:MAG: hypothetical protein SH868_03975 [Bythopirellula sp.]|nr:hypothetical protein [Bythopirellula sp.]
MEARYAFSGGSALTLDDWQSAIFDNGVTGTLPFLFTRNAQTVDPQGTVVPPGIPRFGDETLLSEINSWSEAYADVGLSEILGTGWDHDGQTPLAILWDRTTLRMQFLRGEDFTLANTLNLNTGSGDLLKGTVAGYRYIAQHAVIHEGLVVVMCQRERRSGNTWITEGVSFAYTQDLGQTFARVDQVGGGFDVPAIAGGVTDGMQRARSWSFANAFPEQSTGDMLGAWFPWADYLQQSGSPQGGQIGVFRARRAAIGEEWVVEANKLVYETWRLDDSGGYHAHTAGMFVDGMASFWGDVSYRNQMVRHVAADLENYTTTTWTHQEAFHGGWSPSNAQVHLLGNQAVAAAPGQEFGEILVAGDEQAESIMKVERPEELGDKALISNLRGSFSGVTSGSGYAGRLSIWLQHLRGVGYISKEYESQADNIDALHFSVNGEDWGSLLNLGNSEPYLYGNQVIVLNTGKLYSLELPRKSETSAQAPLLLNPGGFNLATVDWTQTSAPAPGNALRRVSYVGGQYVYADNSQPLDVQPTGAPPVVNGMPMWEVTSDGSSRAQGEWDITGTASMGNQLHWLSAWHYSLDGNGISPQVRIGSVIGSEKESVWYANKHWVPTLDYAVPSPGNANSGDQKIRLFTGNDPAPRRWLMALEGMTQSVAPTYPLAPDTMGANELAQVILPTTTTFWSTALTFGLSEVSAFSSYFDAVGVGIVHTIASVFKSTQEHIDITFTKTTAVAGVLSIDVYSSGLLLDKMSFKSIYWDREDQIRLVISNSPEELGVTMLVTRNGYGLDSKSLVSTGAEFVPTAIYLSNATRTQVTPLEWYAIQFNTTEALTTAEREELVVSDYMFQALDIPPPPTADFDNDADIDGQDFLIWQRGYGSSAALTTEFGDANVDGIVDGLDLILWQAGYGLGGPVGPTTADFNQDGVIDEFDLIAWQNGYGIREIFGAQDQGDSDSDGDVDGRDFLVWQRQYTGPAPEPVVDTTLEPVISESEPEPIETTAVAIIAPEEIANRLTADQALPDVATVTAASVEQSLTPGLSAGFWLSPLPVVNWDRKNADRSDAWIATDIAQRALLMYQADDTFLGKPAYTGRISSESDVIFGKEAEPHPQENDWSSAADLAMEGWEVAL